MENHEVPLDLPTATASLYGAFDGYSRPHEIITDGRTLAAARPDADTMLLKPLRELTAGDLRPYVLKALTTAGTLDDYRYFLPRILELATTSPPEWLDVIIVLSKLGCAQWQTWPLRERSAVRDFCLAWLAALLSSFPVPVSLGELLAGLAQFDQLQYYLGSVQSLAQKSPSARQHVLELAVEHVQNLADQPATRESFRYDEPWWQNQQPNARALLDWILSEQAAQILERAFAERLTSVLATEPPCDVRITCPDWVAQIQRIYTSQRESMRARIRA